MASRFSRMKRSRCANLVAHHQLARVADHRPAFARGLEEDEVVHDARDQHQQRQPAATSRRRELPAAEVQRPGSRARLPWVIRICIAKLLAWPTPRPSPDQPGTCRWPPRWNSSQPLARLAAAAARIEARASRRIGELLPAAAGGHVGPARSTTTGWSLLVANARRGREAAPAGAALEAHAARARAGRLLQFASRFNRHCG